MAKTEENESHKRESKSSGSVATERTKRDQAIEELGRKLISELDDRDITAKWMAAYLSEQMITSEEDGTLKQDTADLILKLWRERRHYLGRNPMQRYEKALSAMELQLSTGDPVFQIRTPFEPPNGPNEDKLSLARKLKHHATCLASMLIKEVVAELDIDQDQLAEVADIADPDEETRFLSVLKVVVYDKEKGDDQNDPHGEIREAISDLRFALEELEGVLLQEVKDPKRIN
ncbi:hypothetical protein CLV80_10119 [Yoonia maritima]|uniref:Uncharacterized protein n=1 Tax=Yoonia maritima TaxID=1435347 RepID=A0A2T0W3W0_9RHOB|nr:hypothetical protein [Yoonia maritima]PRY80169.1 hypothetical protein CLV80_10119 [Yoonia maritima]